MHKLLIAGNHDVTLHPEYYEQHWQRYHSLRGEPYDCAQAIAAVRGAAAKGITYLEDEEVTVEGVRVFGSPWQPEFCNWAFNLERGEPCRQAWARIPTETDVLLTHGPPLGHGDTCRGGGGK